MIFPKNKNSNRGFLMVEVVIATAIIITFVLVALSVASKSVSFAHETVHLTQTSFLLEEGAEAVRIARDNDWTNISNLVPATIYFPTFAGGTWTLSTTPSQVGIFTRSVTVSAVNRNQITGDISSIGLNDPGTKLVNINVSWQEGGQVLSRSLSFYLSNIFL
jgi:Tfp pilus assembly protein PilV